MISCITITKYLSYKFLRYFLFVSLVILAGLFISSAFDVLQKFKSIYVEPRDFWLLIFLKIPSIYSEISSMICFASTILFLRYLSVSNELLIMTSSGLRLWRVFWIPVFVSFILGVIIVAIIGPIASISIKEYVKIETKLNNTPPDDFFISGDWVFFYEKYHDTNYVIQAKSIDQEKKIISDLTIFVVDEQNSFVKRIDAQYAILDNGYFQINKPIIFTNNSLASYPKLSLPTNLSINNLIQKFKPPEMIPIWFLYQDIEAINKSGLPTLKYQIYFFKQIFKPLTMVAMTFVACLFLNLNNRNNVNVRNVLFILVLGFVIYFLLEIILRVLAFGGLSPMVASLLPILSIILISNFVILHFQEA